MEGDIGNCCRSATITSRVHQGAHIFLKPNDEFTEKFGTKAELRNILEEKNGGRGGSSGRSDRRFGKKRRVTKRGTPPPPKKNDDKKGDTAFRRPQDFDVHVVVGINPTAKQDVCASTVHYSSCIHHHCIRTAKCPTAGCFKAYFTLWY